jgi:hypothetical protein
MIAALAGVGPLSCLPVPDDNPRLPGTWLGLLTAHVTVADSYNGREGFVSLEPKESTVKTRLWIWFDEAGVPDRLLVYGLSLPNSWGPTSVDVEAAAAEIPAVLPDETATVTIDWVPYTVTVREATYTPTHGQVVLDMTTAWDRHQDSITTTSPITGSASSSQTLELAWVRQGEQLNWYQSAEATAHGVRIIRDRRTGAEISTSEHWSTQSVVSTGTLTYQPEE